jgi:type IV secretory pathway VirB6-like protein
MIYKVKEKRSWSCIITQNLSFLLNNISCSLSISPFLLLYFGVWVFDFLVEAEEGSKG